MKKILIINSSEEIMTLLKRLLESKAYNVKFTTQLEKVVSILKEFEPQLIIIDIDEKQAIPAIRDYKSSIIILLMAGFTNRDVYPALPVNDIIEKPFTLEALEQKVNYLLITDTLA